ncbi:MAG: DUF881 domain-containing protein [Mycobacteriales bacterium]
MVRRRRGGRALSDSPATARSRTPNRLLAEILEHHLDPAYELAARRRTEDPPSRRELRSGALARNLVLLVIGTLLATAFARASAQAPEAARTRAALAAEARSQSALTDKLQRQAEQLRNAVSADRASALAGSAAGKQAQASLARLELAAGLIAVRGSGLIVTVGDAGQGDPVTGASPPAGSTDAGRVQDRDLAQIVNALWASGAEAISINGQRLSPTSTIRAAGEAILVDFRPVSSPYQVRAIGHSGRMQALFAETRVARSFTTFVQLYGMRFSTGRADAITVPAAPASSLTFATPQGVTR